MTPSALGNGLTLRGLWNGRGMLFPTLTQILAHRSPSASHSDTSTERNTHRTTLFYLFIARPGLHSCSTGRISVFSQIEQKLAEALLSRTASTALSALAGYIHQFCDTFPASSACRCVFSVGEEFLSFLACLGASFIGAIAIGYIKVIDVFLCFLDGSCFLFGGSLGSTG